MRVAIGCAATLALSAATEVRAGVGEDLKAIRDAYETYVAFRLAPISSAPKVAPATAWVGEGPDAEQCKKEWKHVQSFLTAAEKAYRASADWSLTAEAGFSGDNSNGTERAKATFSAEYEVGKYPTQFRVKAGAKLDFDNQRGDELSEDVSEIVLQFDHYPRHDLEAFAFLERFSDTFMSIDQRYETGAGAKWEVNLWRPVGSEKDHEALLAAGKKLREIAGGNSKCLVDATGQPLKIPGWVSESTDANVIHTHLRREAARVELGISVAVMAEFEQSDTLKFTTQIGTDPSVEQSVKPDGTQRYRLSIRPSVKWEILEGLEFRARVYYKPALDEPHRVNGRRDYRVDGRASVEWTVGSIRPAPDKKVSLSLEYDYRYDPVPPDASAFLATLGVPREQITITGSPAGNRQHSATALKVKVAL